jgi:phage terminase large subunit
MKNNSSTSSVWQIVLSSLKKSLKRAQKFISRFSPTTLQFIQLTVMYFLAVVDLLHSVLNNVFSLGYVPEALMPFYPFIKFILMSRFFNILFMHYH